MSIQLGIGEFLRSTCMKNDDACATSLGKRILINLPGAMRHDYRTAKWSFPPTAPSSISLVCTRLTDFTSYLDHTQ
jgi:hypothetical protein